MNNLTRPAYFIIEATVPVRLAFALLLITFMAAGCSDNGLNLPAKKNSKAATFGLVEVTISGIGGHNMQATSKPRPVASTISRPAGAATNFIQMEPVSNGSFTSGTRGAGGQRYIYATFKVRNAQADGTPYSDARQNLTFLAADTDPSATATETIGETAIATLRLFDGTELSGSTAETIANQTIPTGQVAQNGSSDIISTSADVLQVYTENDLNDITPPSGVSLFPYGFITRNASTPSSRSLPASPAAGQFDGEVTFAFRLPLQTGASDDPFEISALFLPVDDSQTRITQSLEEQTAEGRTALRQRANDLSANITLLPGSTYRGAAALQCSPVRTAGTDASPAANLFPQPPTFNSLTPDPYASNGSAAHIAASSDFTATFSGPVNGANARSFVVQGAQSGQPFLGQSYSGNGTTSITTPAGSFFPGETVEASLTPGLGICPGTVARYRVATTAGAGTFGPATNFAAGTRSFSVALGDLDGDGALDMTVANAYSSNVNVWLGNGAGGFGPATDFAAGSGSYSVALGDLNADGALDMAVANGNSSNVSVLLGDGAGGFGVATTFAAGIRPFSVALGDLNGDGALDMAVANRNSSNVSVLLGDGAGGFGPTTNFAAGTRPHSVALGDLNGDGALDMAVANYDSGNVSVLLGDGAGGFGPATNFVADAGPLSVVLGDLNGDGALDMAVANANSNNVSVLLGDGAGGFGPATNFAAGTSPHSVALGDLNGDGALDMAVANYDSGNVSVRLGNGAGGFGAATNFATHISSISVALGDLDGDGALDMTVANASYNDVSVLLNQ